MLNCAAIPWGMTRIHCALGEGYAPFCEHDGPAIALLELDFVATQLIVRKNWKAGKGSIIL